MGDAEVIELKKELAAAQIKLCEERHGNIDDRLKKIEGHQKSMNFWLIGIMGTTIVQLIILVVNLLPKVKG